LDPEIQASIRALLDEFGPRRTDKRPEQLIGTASVIYGDAMNKKRYVSHMEVVFRAQRMCRL